MNGITKPMKQLKKYLLLLFFISTYSMGHSQSDVVLEQIQIFSTTQPTANYWKLPNDISLLEQTLDSGIFKEYKLTRNKQFKPSIKTLSKQSQVGKIVLNWDSTRNIPYHAYVELYELDPSTLYMNKLIKVSEEKKDSIHSVWAVAVDLFNEKHEKIFQKTVLIGLMPSQNTGMGHVANFLPTVPSNLYQAITKGLSFINTGRNNLYFVEAKVAEAFFTDNYWMPLVHNYPRTTFDTSKQFFNYQSAKGLQLLRIPNANLLKLDLKNKNPDYPFKDIVEQIKKSRSGARGNEYYQAIQYLRDVHADKDYTITTFLEFNPDNIHNDNDDEVHAINFLSDVGNYIVSGVDTIGKFQIKEMVTEKDKFYLPNKVYNGYDSSKQYIVQSFDKVMPITHSKVIAGKLYEHSFSIQYDNDHSLKTILVDDKVVMIIDGEKKPRQMVCLPNELNDTFRNLLILIAYSEIFQSPH